MRFSWHKLNMVNVLQILLMAVFWTVPAYAQTGGSAGQGVATQRVFGGVKSWGYQLQKGDPDVIAASPFDVVVVDYSRSGDEEGRFTREEVERMKRRPDGGRRIVLAYLSIGEAENYRFYWSEDWVEPLKVIPEGDIAADKAETGKSRTSGRLRTMYVPRLSAPSWLGRENDTWIGNFLVRYWDPTWQSIIFGRPDSYLERLIETGFDGVYLDRVDAFLHVQDERPTARAEMQKFVIALAHRARSLKPGFAIVPQNGEDLLSDQAYLSEIDGIAKEDLLFGQPTEGQRNAPAVIARASNLLQTALQRSLPVFVVEYVTEKTAADKLRLELTSKGYIPYFTIRSLDRLVLPEELKPGVQASGAPADVPRTGTRATKQAPAAKKR